MANITTVYRPAGMTDKEWRRYLDAKIAYNTKVFNANRSSYLGHNVWVGDEPDPEDFMKSNKSSSTSGVSSQSVMKLLDKLKTMQQEYEEAARKREEEMLSYADQLGQSRAAEINRAATQQQASAGQSLVSRGLGNSTIVDSVNRGIASDKQSQLTHLGETLAGMKLGIVGQRPIYNPMFNVYTQLLGRADSDAINKALLGGWY